MATKRAVQQTKNPYIEDGADEDGPNPAEDFEAPDPNDLEVTHDKFFDAKKAKEELELNIFNAEKDILFIIQGVGSVKNVQSLDVYVKDENCESSLKDLIRQMKLDSPKQPIAKQILGKWSFLQRDLLPLLIFHDRDKRLAFLTLMLLVQLTALPESECDGKMKLELLSQLVSFK